jgi:hypothetical protein
MHIFRYFFVRLQPKLDCFVILEKLLERDLVKIHSATIDMLCMADTCGEANTQFFCNFLPPHRESFEQADLGRDMLVIQTVRDTAVSCE